MIIKLTNASKEYDGQTLLINSRHILSVFEGVKTLDDKTVETVTNIYTITKESWIVKETIEDIYNKVNV